jgi:hypothetical protein
MHKKHKIGIKYFVFVHLEFPISKWSINHIVYLFYSAMTVKSINKADSVFKIITIDI